MKSRLDIAEAARDRIVEPTVRAARESRGGSEVCGEGLRPKMATPHGWPKDAIDAPLIGLCAEGHLKAERSGSLVLARALIQQAVRTALSARIGSTEDQSEGGSSPALPRDGGAYQSLRRIGEGTRVSGEA